MTLDANKAFRGTPFHARTAAANRTTWWYGWGEYVVPDVYSDVYTEMQAIRTAASMNEMSPLPKMEIRGADAQRFVDYVITRDAGKLDVGHVWYTPWCNHDGWVVSDGLVFRFAEDRYVFSGDRSVGFFRDNAAGFSVSIDDVTDDYGVLALQGPQSRQVLEQASGMEWSGLEFSHIRTASINGVAVNVARQGFTGELGYELWVERTCGTMLWDAIAAAGAELGIQPAGEYAIDIARVEPGLILISADYAGAGTDERSAHVVVDVDNRATPFELGLGHFVDFEQPADFIGREALSKLKQEGASREIVGIEPDWRAITDLFVARGMAPLVSPRVRWDALPVVDGQRKIGRATSITWSPTLEKMIGFACVENAFAARGGTLTIQWADDWGRPLGNVPAAVVEYPFIEMKRSS